jgi:hypothetical protein
LPLTKGEKMGVKIRQKKNGGPWWVFICKDKIRKSKMIGTFDAAVEYAKEMELELASGTFVRTRTFKECAYEWMHKHVEANCSRRTWGEYLRYLNKLILPRLGDCEINKMTNSSIHEFLREYCGKIPSDRIYFLRAVLHSVLKFAVMNDYIKANPATDIRLMSSEIGSVEGIYVMKNQSGSAKIGFSTDVARRRRTIQSSNPDRISIMAITVGSKEKERQVLKRFSELKTRERTEWVKMTEAVDDFAQRLSSPV